ncbi:MAG TPA: NDP-sugar synthase [Pyrinomonadaceae bacterium]|nr:NDP-sugar synthase [Pyrinomonadaceae bacterium]
MKALILAGGKGTRLRPLTVYTPKPIVPLANRPFLQYQIEILAKAGIDEIVLSLSYQPDKIEDILGDGSDLGIKLSYVTEPSPLGTGGAYRFAAIGTREPFIVLNGDILTNVDIAALVDFHRKNSAEATICLAHVDDPSSFGLVELSGDQRVIRFLEKPSADDLGRTAANTINAGIYVLEPSILDLVPRDENRSFEYDVFPEILRQERAFYGYTLESSYWLDIGDPKRYLKANLDLLDGRVDGFEVKRPNMSEVATAADIDKISALGDGCVIKPGARIVRSVIGPGVHIEERCNIEDSVIWAHSRIVTAADIRGSVIGKSCYIGRNALVGTGSVLGDKASIPDYSQI